MSGTPHHDGGSVGQKLVYVLERFPADTLNFVYNEIKVLEAQGFDIDIFSLLPSLFCPEAARDFQDRTTVVKPVSAGGLLKAVGHYLLRKPGRLLGLFLTLPFDNADGFLHKFPRSLSHTLYGVYFAYLVRGRGSHVHAHFAHKAATAALCASRLNGTTFSFTAHGSATVHPPSRYSLVSKIRNAHLIVSVSEFNRRMMLELCPECPTERIVVNRTGILLEDFPLRPAPRKARPPFRILCVASLYPIKNHEGLLEACAGLVRFGVEFQLDLVGKDEGERGRVLAERAEALGIGDRVAFHGLEDHGRVARRLEQADLFILTSHSEGIPVAMMEAMAVGVPVLGPRVTGLSELVEEDVTGWLADPGRPGEFTTVMRRILEEPGHLGRVVQPARDNIAARYDMKANARMLARIFRDRIPG